METPPSKQSPTIQALEKAIDTETHEQKALEIALKEEKSCIEQYSVLVRDIIDPLVRAIFERVVKETENHYALIEDEYMHVMKMVDKSDQDIYVRE
jgi:rubrerythrin